MARHVTRASALVKPLPHTVPHLFWCLISTRLAGIDSQIGIDASIGYAGTCTGQREQGSCVVRPSVAGVAQNHAASITQPVHRHRGVPAQRIAIDETRASRRRNPAWTGNDVDALRSWPAPGPLRACVALRAHWPLHAVEARWPRRTHRSRSACPSSLAAVAIRTAPSDEPVLSLEALRTRRTWGTCTSTARRL